MTLTEVSLADVPLYNGDVEAEGDPDAVAALKTAVDDADGLIVFTPEYNRNYTFIGTEGRIENMGEGGDVICKMRNQTKKWKNFSDRTHHVTPAAGGHGGPDPTITGALIALLLTARDPQPHPPTQRLKTNPC